MDNFANFVFIALICIGVIVAMQGVQIARGRRRPKIFPPEKAILTVLTPPNAGKMLQALGRMRIMYGVFFVVIGMWALLA